MKNIDLESLGFTEQQLFDRVVECVCDRILHTEESDEDGERYVSESRFIKELNAELTRRINTAVTEIANRHVQPTVEKYIEDLRLTETNKWGENAGSTMTFIEYLVKRAESYMTEMVDFNGKTRAENSYNWHGTQTRITHMIHKYLHYHIENFAKAALATANSAIVSGIQKAVELKLAEVQEGLQVTVKTK